MILTTSTINERYESLGLVFGHTARTRGVFGRISVIVDMVLGGRVKVYIDEIEKAKNEALEDLMKKAQEKGADGIIGIDFDVSDIFQGVVFVSVNGTAIKLIK